MPDADRNLDTLVRLDDVGWYCEVHSLREYVMRVWRQISDVSDQPPVHKHLVAVVHARYIQRKRCAIRQVQYAKPIPRDSRVALVTLFVPGLSCIKQMPIRVRKAGVSPRGIVLGMKAPRSGEIRHGYAVVAEVD